MCLPLGRFRSEGRHMGLPVRLRIGAVRPARGSAGLP